MIHLIRRRQCVAFVSLASGKPWAAEMCKCSEAVDTVAGVGLFYHCATVNYRKQALLMGDETMGAFVGHRHIPHTQARMNFRFAHGDGLKEMVAFQKHFEVFSHKHPLSRSFSLVDAVPHDAKERRGFLRYLDRMANVGSNVKGQNGHAAIVAALKKNLESKSPLPVHFTYHVDPQGSQKVKISTSRPLAYSAVKYLTISFPSLRER
jgi:hypothetical protein